MGACTWQAKAHLKTSCEAQDKLCRVSEAVIEVLAGHVGVDLAELLQRHRLIKVILAVVDEPHPIQKVLVRVPGLVLYRLPHVPEQSPKSLFNLHDAAFAEGSE